MSVTEGGPRAGKWRVASTVLAAMAALAMGVLAVTAAPVGAHGGSGVVDVGDVSHVGPLQIEFPIRVTYENDGHPSEETEGLTVTGEGPDGARFGPVEPFVAGDAPGVHLATVDLPAAGSWDLVIDIVEPPSSATLSVEVPGPAAEDGPEGPQGAPEQGADAADGTEDAVEPIAPVTAVEDADDDGGFWSTQLLVAGLIAGVAVGGLGSWWISTRRTQPDAG